MAARRCKAFGCPNKRKNGIAGLHYHRFPTDSERCEIWIKNMKCEYYVKSKTADELNRCLALCSDHFEDWCFMNVKEKSRLVWNAVPTILNGNNLTKQTEHNKKKETVTTEPESLVVPPPGLCDHNYTMDCESADIEEKYKIPDQYDDCINLFNEVKEQNATFCDNSHVVTSTELSRVLITRLMITSLPDTTVTSLTKVLTELKEETAALFLVLERYYSRLQKLLEFPLGMKLLRETANTEMTSVADVSSTPQSAGSTSVNNNSTSSRQSGDKCGQGVSSENMSSTRIKLHNYSVIADPPDEENHSNLLRMEDPGTGTCADPESDASLFNKNDVKFPLVIKTEEQSQDSCNVYSILPAPEVSSSDGGRSIPRSEELDLRKQTIKCKRCGLTFSSKIFLKNHRKRCSKKDKRERRKLKDMEKRQRRRQERNSCKICGLTFKRVATVRNHYLIAHQTATVTFNETDYLDHQGAVS